MALLDELDRHRFVTIDVHIQGGLPVSWKADGALDEYRVFTLFLERVPAIIVVDIHESDGVPILRGDFKGDPVVLEEVHCPMPVRVLVLLLISGGLDHLS